MAIKVAIMNEKGGVGKTATATTMAYILADLDYKTLIIDFDGQAHSTFINGINPNNIKTSISTLINRIKSDEPLPDEYIIENKNGVHIIPANSELFSLERTLCNIDFRETKLSEVVAHFEDKYDFIIIDCMPQMGTPMVNALMCADEIIIPTQTQLLSAQGLGTLIRHINILKKMNHHLKISGILITMDDKKTKLSASMVEFLHDNFGKEIRIFASKIPRSIKVPEACTKRKTICEYLPNNPASYAYEGFVFEWLDTHGEGGK
jgi:chromosome partitioning protein